MADNSRGITVEDIERAREFAMREITVPPVLMLPEWMQEYSDEELIEAVKKERMYAVKIAFVNSDREIDIWKDNRWKVKKQE